MDDLDDVRTALGYEQINIFGGSYGTRAAMVYLRQHPKHVRTIILQGVAPTNQFMPYDFAQGNERSLQGVLAECAADETCNSAFPHLPAEVKSVLDRLLEGPVEVELTMRNPPGSQPTFRKYAGAGYCRCEIEAFPGSGGRSDPLHAL